MEIEKVNNKVQISVLTWWFHLFSFLKYYLTIKWDNASWGRGQGSLQDPRYLKQKDIKHKEEQKKMLIQIF